MSHLLGALWPSDIGRGLREGLFMFWQTLWALVLGFTLSGMVRAFVSTQAVERRLGSHTPRAVAEASAYGMVSSSCSYAASAMAKSLFQKGADFVSAIVFMFASTNLVIELGIVMLVLLGWQFTFGEVVGSPIMIILLASFGGLVLRGPLVARARERLRRVENEGTHSAAAGESGGADDPALGWTRRLQSKGAWSEAAGYAVADLKMLRRELVIGYAVAGFVAVLVPTTWWRALFLHGHGVWTALEGAVVGPVIAVLSWVCSVGNVPLAAALWRGGIGFGGVISFIFADLIAMPLVLIYRKYYGGRLTVRLVGVLYVGMVLSALSVAGLFALAGIVPRTSLHPTTVVGHFSWDYTSVLDIASLVAAAVLYRLYRSRRGIASSTLAFDPVCGMQVRAAEAPASARHLGRTLYFCSDHCRERFESDPARFLPRKEAGRTAVTAADEPSVAGHTGCP